MYFSFHLYRSLCVCLPLSFSLCLSLSLSRSLSPSLSLSRSLSLSLSLHAFVFSLARNDLDGSRLEVGSSPARQLMFASKEFIAFFSTTTTSTARRTTTTHGHHHHTNGGASDDGRCGGASQGRDLAISHYARIPSHAHTPQQPGSSATIVARRRL